MIKSYTTLQPPFSGALQHSLYTTVIKTCRTPTVALNRTLKGTRKGSTPLLFRSFVAPTTAASVEQGNTKECRLGASGTGRLCTWRIMRLRA